MRNSSASPGVVVAEYLVELPSAWITVPPPVTSAASFSGVMQTSSVYSSTTLLVTERKSLWRLKKPAARRDGTLRQKWRAA